MYAHLALGACVSCVFPCAFVSANTHTHTLSIHQCVPACRRQLMRVDASRCVKSDLALGAALQICEHMTRIDRIRALESELAERGSCSRCYVDANFAFFLSLHSYTHTHTHTNRGRPTHVHTRTLVYRHCLLTASRGSTDGASPL